MASSIDFIQLEVLSELNTKAPVAEKLKSLHRIVRQKYEFIHRIGVAVYDPELDLLKTFAHSTDCGNPLPHYSAKLSKATSLYQIHLDRTPRVVNDLDVFNDSDHQHAKRIISHGYRSSYTVPIYQDDDLLGFIFFNSRHPGVFQTDCLPYLDINSRLISLLITK